MEFAGFEIETPPKLENARLKSLYEYWLALARQAGGLPSIQSFDPLRLPQVLSNIWILEVAPENGRFRMRLAGEDINAVYGRSIAGHYFAEVFSPHEVDLIVERYRRALSEPVIFTARGAVYAAAGRLTEGERIGLPMLGREGVTNTLLGATVYGARLVPEGQTLITGGLPRFYAIRAANHRAPQISGG